MLLNVYREKPSTASSAPTFEIVGNFNEDKTGQLTFTYDETYAQDDLNGSISCFMPIYEQSFDARDTRVFFEGLLPEERSRQDIQRAIHEDSSMYANILKTLNCETAGALVIDFETPTFDSAHYEQIDEDVLAIFAKNPRRTQLELSMASRLSLSGAQSKIGLYQNPAQDNNWYIPKGFAPSTHILKCADGTFENQMINEAICMKLAKRCGLSVAEVNLLDAEGETSNPILVTRRFDRPFLEMSGKRCVDKLEMPIRLHQEDFCQALGLPLFLKYEPTDGHYASLIAHILDEVSADPIADKIEFFRGLIFDYYIGNCDNHLKNRSILWTPDWQSRCLAPLYDLTSTTVYPQLDRQMGVAFCESRVIDDVTPEDIANVASGIGIGSKMAWRIIGELLEGVERHSKEVVDEIISSSRGSKTFAVTTKDFYAEFAADVAPRLKVLEACVG